MSAGPPANRRVTSKLAAIFLGAEVEEAMPFTFKLSQRLARIRRRGPVAPAVAPAVVPVSPSQLAVSRQLLSLEWNQIADRIFVGAVQSLCERSPRAEREDITEVGEFDGAPVSPYLTVVAVGRCGCHACKTITNNEFRDCGASVRLVPSGGPARTT